MGKQFSFSAGGVVVVLLVLLGLATPAFSLKVNTTLNVSAWVGFLLLCSKGTIFAESEVVLRFCLGCTGWDFLKSLFIYFPQGLATWNESGHRPKKVISFVVV